MKSTDPESGLIITLKEIQTGEVDYSTYENTKDLTETNPYYEFIKEDEIEFDEDHTGRSIEYLFSDGQVTGRVFDSQDVKFNQVVYRDMEDSDTLSSFRLHYSSPTADSPDDYKYAQQILDTLTFE